MINIILYDFIMLFFISGNFISGNLIFYIDFSYCYILLKNVIYNV